MREKEGNVLQSNEVVTAVGVLAIFVALGFLGQYMLGMLLQATKKGIQGIGAEFVPTAEYFIHVFIDVIICCLIIVMPVALLVGLAIIISVFAQTKGYFAKSPIKFKFSKLSPINGFKKLFSIQSAVGVLKGLLELTVIGVVLYTQISSRFNDFSRLGDCEPIQIVAYIADAIYSIAILIGVILVFVAAADYLFQWWQYEKNLKMSKQEIKDEYKQTEGDPQIKSKIKQKQREISQRRMMDEVPKADVVVRNPTHYAVALTYDISSATAAPMVVAKGQDALALKIIAVAEENNIYITENRPLARSLYESVEIGREIPQALFVAVATIIMEMYTAKGKRLVLPEAGDEAK